MTEHAQRIAEIARAATDSGSGMTVLDVRALPGGHTVVRLSSWERADEASRALRERGYVTHDLPRGAPYPEIAVHPRYRPTARPVGRVWVGPAHGEIMGWGSDGNPLIASEDGIEPMEPVGLAMEVTYEEEDPEET